MPENATLSVEGMNCASCVSHVERAARAVGGVVSIHVNLATGRAALSFDAHKTNAAAVAAAITDAGYPAAPAISVAGEAHKLHADAWLIRTIVAVFLWLPVEAMHWLIEFFGNGRHLGMAWMVWLSFVMGTISVGYVGWGFYRGAWVALRQGTSNMDTLISLGAIVAYGYSVVALAGKTMHLWPAPPAYYFMEASGLLALISLGHWLEAHARHAAGSAINSLMTLAPATALRLDAAGQASETALDQVAIGDKLLVRPGDRVPTDGNVVEGRSSVDESMISGEPIPPVRTIGDEVIGGTLNLDGRLVIEARQVGAQTALAQMVKLVESAQAAKPPVQRLADKVAAVFVPVVLVIALVTGVSWFAWGHAHQWQAGVTWAALANAVCSVLIIACPCALGLALPAALMVGTGVGARQGILLRDLDALQHAEKIGTVVLDKTGTLTEGRPEVAQIVPMNGAAEAEILSLAAAAEQSSSHPLAKAIVAEAQKRRLKIGCVEAFSSEAGYGVSARIDGREVIVGSPAFLARFGWASDGENTVIVAEKRDGRVWPLGALQFADTIKADSAAAIAELHSLGLKTALLTGDSVAAAQAAATAVGIGAVRARVKPDEKAAVIRQLQQSGPVAMVGDGINDAPALAAADLGIAIGSGSDIAKEAGGIVLVSGSLHGVAAAIRLSRATMRTIRRNLVFAFAYNVLAIPLAAFGLLNPLIAAAAMALSDVTVIGSALLLYRIKLSPPAGGSRAGPSRTSGA